jgi:aminopeptidase N
MRYFCFLMLLPLLSFAQEKICVEPDSRGYSREHQVNFHHLSLDLDIHPKEQMVEGRVTLSFTPLRPQVDSIWLDGPKVDFLNVRQDDGRKLGFIPHEDGAFVIAPKNGWKLDEPVSIEVEYRAYPRKGLYFSGWYDEEGFGQIWSQGQGIDNRHWFPHFDGLNNKITSEIKLSFDSEYQVVSNGRLVSVEPDGDNKLKWHWLMDQPHSSYLIMLAVAKLEYHDTTSSAGVMMRNYFYPQWREQAPWVYRYTTDIMDWLEEETGVPYPWMNYKQVPIRDFIYGAMENTTATIFKDAFFTDSVHFDRTNYVYINTHEMAHQWFGNLITSWSPQHHWLHESFATYFHQKVLETFSSPDEYDYQRFFSALGTKRHNMRSSKPLAHGDAGTEYHYGKGSVVLTMLEDWVGQPLFQRSLTYFLNQYGFDNVRSENLMDAFHRVTGYSMDRFWDQWVFRSGEPFLTATARPELRKKKTAGWWMVVEQDSSRLRDARLFHLPIRLEIHPEKGEVYEQVFWLKNEKDSIFIEGDVQFIVVDPRKILLAHWKIDVPDTWWQSQAIAAKFSIDRRLAFLSSDNVKVFREMFENASYGPERAFFLSEYFENDTNLITLIRRYQNDAHWEVRRVVYNSVQDLDVETQAIIYREGIQDPHEVIKALCLSRLLPIIDEEEQAFILQQTKPERVYDQGIFRFEWLSKALEYLDDKEPLLDELVFYMRPRHPGAWRIEAMELLEEYNHFPDEVVHWIMEGYVHFDRPLRRECERVLQKLHEKEPARLEKIRKAWMKTPQQRERLDKLWTND